MSTATDIGAVDSREELAYAIGVQAFVYTFPLWEMARMRAGTAPRKNASGRFADEDPAATRRWVNTFIHARKLLTAGGSRVVTPNNDTLYTNAWLDLSRGPLVMHVPDTGDRYYVLGFLDFYTNPFAHVGRRLTGTSEGLFLLTGPGWTGTVPAGMRQVAAPTDSVWIIGRILVDGPDEVPAVNALQDQFWLKPLATWSAGAGTVAGGGHGGDTAGTGGEVADCWMDFREPISAARYVAIVNRALRQNPPPRAETALLAEFAKVGIGGGEPESIDHLAADVRRGLERALESGQRIVRGTLGESVREGWIFPATLTESFGNDYLRRAIVAMKYIGALASAEATYPMAEVDHEGRPLDGAHRYRLVFPPGGQPPVDAYWSLTMYDAGDFMLVPNLLDRYKVGDRTRHLQCAADGSLTILIQHSSPGVALESNWLPAPAGRFYLTLRAYQPRTEILDGRYRLPLIERVA